MDGVCELLFCFLTGPRLGMLILTSRHPSHFPPHSLREWQPAQSSPSLSASSGKRGRGECWGIFHWCSYHCFLTKSLHFGINSEFTSAYFIHR